MDGRQRLVDRLQQAKGAQDGILINAAAAVVVALGFLSLGYVFRGEQSAVSLASAGFQSAEGRLLEVFRRQSESRLQEEQAQTLEAEERLRATEGSLEGRLREREQALRRPPRICRESRTR